MTADSKTRVLADFGIGPLARWWHRRRIYRRELARAAWDLRERYGPAAPSIARNCARQPVGRERRRFWRNVAAELARRRLT